MKDVPIYFTPEEYDRYRNGDRAIGYTAQQKMVLQALENVGVDCELKTEPLSHMTKVRTECISDLKWSWTGMYVERLKSKNRGAVEQ